MGTLGFCPHQLRPDGVSLHPSVRRPHASIANDVPVRECVLRIAADARQQPPTPGTSSSWPVQFTLTTPSTLQAFSAVDWPDSSSPFPFTSPFHLGWKSSARRTASRCWMAAIDERSLLTTATERSTSYPVSLDNILREASPENGRKLWTRPSSGAPSSLACRNAVTSRLTRTHQTALGSEAMTFPMTVLHQLSSMKVAPVCYRVN